MRTLKKKHTARYSPIADLETHSPLPTFQLQQIDPFIFLNHHGPQVYPQNNQGLPFGPHPHRGMETVTFVIDGDIMHKDSTGAVSVINAGGIQWMTAGKGLIHAEVSSPEFMKNGGQLEILQLWLNLPAKYKMIEPFYKGLQEHEIPKITLDHNAGTLQLISGNFNDSQGAFQSVTGVFLSVLYLNAQKSITFNAPKENSIFFYVVRGTLTVNTHGVKMLDLLEFAYDNEQINIETSTDCIVLYGHCKPISEPFVAQGPFVMNTEQEILEAYDDYRKGKFGVWKH
ncbi:MAG: pirin family protein [Cytophagales bacterium]